MSVANIVALAERNRLRCPDKVAIVDRGRHLTYADFARRMEAGARALAAMGVKPGDRVAILARNCAAFYELFAAAGRAGACLVPLNHRLAAAEIAWILADARPRLLFADVEFAGLAQTASDESGTDTTLVTFDDDPWSALPAATGLDAPAADRFPTADDRILQLYTSGTTGRPKGVCLDNRNLRAVWKMSSAVPGFDYAEEDMVLAIMPQFHVAGINNGLLALLSGATMIVGRAFEPDAVLALIEEHRCTRAFLVPSMIGMLVEHPDLDPARCASLKQIAYGGSAITGAALAKARARLGCAFAQLYGMTESFGAGTVLSPDEHDLNGKAGSCGRAWPGVAITIVDEDGAPLPSGQRGEIVLGGDCVMTGYWNNPDATRAACCQFGLLTGDGGYLDTDGFLFIEDRIKDMIISGGENVAPTEVENAIAGCPGVRDVAVVGVESEQWGEEIRAFIVAEEDARPSAADIIAWARRHIAAFKCPKSIQFVDDIPRNASGKILRRELRESAARV